MFAVLLSHWMKERRNPSMVLLFIGISIMVTLMFGGSIGTKMKIDVISEAGLSQQEQSEWLSLLNESEIFAFQIQEETSARAKVREGRADMALLLMPEDYRIIAAIQSPNIQLAEQHIQTVFQQELRLRYAAESESPEGPLREDVKTYLQQPPLRVQTSSMTGEALVQYDMSIQLLFGFSLFLAMLTIGFKVNTITKEKTSGIWDRMILSPVRKTEMYLGHLLYSSIIGVVQIVIVLLIFHFVFGFNLGERYDLLFIVIVIYTLSIVALSMLFVGILRTPEQFGMIFPSIVPLMPLISGVYMPPGMITSKVLLGVAQCIPLTHAMEALNGIAMYDAGWSDILYPMTKMILIGVLCMGIGINLMERRNA